MCDKTNGRRASRSRQAPAPRDSTMESRAAALAPVVGQELVDRVGSSRVLVVGAGGIGCELLKNLAMCGFGNVELIDLDTIDVTNLNRQFLFQKQHVGQSKANVAGAAVQRMHPTAKVTAVHGNIMDPERDMAFFKQFDLVLNALDNIAARNHVNRLCHAADVPLIESGTAGYLGQVAPILKGSECYECQPKEAPKSYPVCTIRNTPSLPIHCIVWAKFLFGQLFGVPDDENDVTPDTADPELGSDAADAPAPLEPAGTSGAASTAPDVPARQTVRMFAETIEYDPRKLFDKLFRRDIATLLSLEKLWKKRSPPVPIDIDDLPDEPPRSVAADEVLLDDQKLWSVAECCDRFLSSTAALAARSCTAEKELEWDKDDDDAMIFVTATAALRSLNFDIPRKSLFETKSMAGKIIPAIATTNAVIAGLIVMEALKVLRGAPEDCRAVYFSRTPQSRGRVLSAVQLAPPNPTCFVCKERSELYVRVDTTKATVGMLCDAILKKRLGLAAPDVTFGLTQLIDSDPDVADSQRGVVFPRTLESFGVRDGSQLECEDFLQKMQFRLTVQHTEMPDPDIEFEISGELKPLGDHADDDGSTDTAIDAVGDDSARSTIKRRRDSTSVGDAAEATVVDDEDDIMIVDEEAPAEIESAPKRTRQA